MKTITKIDTVGRKYTPAKKRVAAYCRVSTASDEQLLSLKPRRLITKRSLTLIPSGPMLGSTMTKESAEPTLINGRIFREC